MESLLIDLIFVFTPQSLRKGILQETNKWMDARAGTGSIVMMILLRAHELASDGRSEVHTSNNGMGVHGRLIFFYTALVVFFSLRLVPF